MEKDPRRDKLQKKMEGRRLTIYEALQEQFAVEWLKTGHPAFLSMLTPEALTEAITYLIIPGPPNDKIRSYKVPMITAELLSTLVPRVFELFFSEDPAQKGGIMLGHLLRYFDSAPNYVISGYVARILMSLMAGNPARVLEYLYKNHPERMIRFLESQSIAQFLIRIIVVEDALLNAQAKERVALLTAIVQLYSQNKESEEVLGSMVFVLGEAFTRLWSQKHKELGRFSGTLFRLVEIVIDQDGLYQQETLLLTVVKHLSLYHKEAPFLLVAIFRKIQQQLGSRAGENLRGQSRQVYPRLSMRRFKYLQCLSFIFAHGSEALVKHLPSSNIFTILLDYIPRYQWNSLALVEIERIIKAASSSGSDAVYAAMIRSQLPQRLRELKKASPTDPRFGNGYGGLLRNLGQYFSQGQGKDALGGWVRGREGPESWKWVKQLWQGKQEEKGSLKVVQAVARPVYSLNRLPQMFRGFFDETEEINARMQTESPGKHAKQEEDVLHEIQNQNQLVYKLLSQLVSETGQDEKKPDSQANQ